MIGAIGGTSLQTVRLDKEGVMRLISLQINSPIPGGNHSIIYFLKLCIIKFGIPGR